MVVWQFWQAIRRSPDEGAAAVAGVEVLLSVAGAGLGEGKLFSVLLLFVVGSIGA